MKAQFFTLIYFLIFLFSLNLFSQESTAGKIYLDGYQKQLAGDTITYNSTIAGINHAMITRGLSEYKASAWITAVVPSDLKENNVVFSWFSGMGRQPMDGSFHVSVNGQEWFDFSYSDGKEWQKPNKNGAVLSFKEYSLDENNDRFGFMFLEVPKSLLEPGKSVELQVKGDPVGSWAWFMVFKSYMKQGMNCEYIPALVNEKGDLKQQFSLNCMYYGVPVKGKILLDGEFYKNIDLKFGYNRYLISTAYQEKSRVVKVSLETADAKFSENFNLKPAKKWQMNFVQHVHTDIGYTRPQTEILAEHIRFLDYVLDYCDATDNYPDDSKFRWTCEASWAVEKFLQTRPQQQIERFLKRIKEGRIEVTGMHFNFDELPDEQVLAASLQPLKIVKKYNIPVKTAMQDDVNGIGWCFNDYFNQLGIKYLNMGTHGHRALIAFDKPTAFWWESPAGNRMLAFRAEHYMTGNTAFAIHTGNFERFEAAVMNYLSSLEKKDYPLDIIAIQHSGYLTDNAPPSTVASDLIRQWNNKYSYPKLKTALVSEFFETVEEKYSDQLPVFRAAWPDWWTDGFGASAREVMAMREAQTDLISAQGAFTMAALAGVQLPDGFDERIRIANEALLYYGEHTVGYSESVREPFGKSTMEQRSLKEAYAWEALRRARIAREEALGMLQTVVNTDENVTIHIFNTLNWIRSGLAVVYIDHQILDPEKQFEIKDEQGNLMLIQPLESRSDGTYWAMWLNDIPAMGHKSYVLKQLHEERKPVFAERNKPSSFSNKWYDIKIDYEKGVISSLFDKELKIELCDEGADWALGQFIYEQLANRNQMERFTLEDYSRTPMTEIEFAGFQKGPIWNSLFLKGSSAAAMNPGDCNVEIRLYNTEKKVDLLYSVIKKPVVDAEGIYIAMPFQLDKGNIYFDVPGGVVKAGYDQIPGSANDWNTVQNFVSIRNEQNEIIVTPYEAPLMQMGDINTGRYKAGAKPSSTHIYGWPMNNYWTTNFNADQVGYHEWHYSLTSKKKESFDATTRQNWGNRIPFLVRVIPGNERKNTVSPKTFMAGIPENVLVVNAIPTGQGSALLQLRECSGNPAEFKITASGKKISYHNSNALGQKIKETAAVNLKPFESRFILISWQE